MNLLITVVVAAVTLVSGASSSSCSIATLSKLLLDPYIDQCATDSKYSFTSGVQPDEEEVAGMCASDACHSLLADVEALNLTECTLPIGNNINLFADLIDYVSDQCDADTPAPTPTPEPTTTTPTPTTTTPAPTTVVASCTSAQLRYLLTSSYQSQCATDASYTFTAPYAPTDTQVAAMCASSSCVNLFAYVASMVTADCRIPVGGKILLLADLVDYVTDECEADTPASTTVTPEPTTAAPTPEPTIVTPTPTTSTPVTTCGISVISALLTDPYIDQCAADSGYSFTSGVQPDAEEVAGMCTSTACANLLANVEAIELSECILPIGNKIYLFRDLVDYVADQCAASTETPSTTTPSTETPITTTPGTQSPSTGTPSTDTPTTENPSTDTPTTAPGTQPSTVTPTTDAPKTGAPSTGTPVTNTPAPDTPTTETPEPTSPIHNSC